MNHFEDMHAQAMAGAHWAQRMLVGFLTLAADYEDDPIMLLDSAVTFARGASRGDVEDFAAMIHALMKRAALADGVQYGGEAVARLEVAANSGHVSADFCAQALNRIADEVPAEISAAFFASAKDIMREVDNQQGGRDG